MMKFQLSLAFLCLALTAAPALADDDCDAPMPRWQPRSAVLQLAARQGWRLHHLKIDDGCYEIRGRDAQGRPFKAKLDPATLRVVKMKGGDHENERSKGQGSVPAPAPPSSPILTPGTAPRGQIE
jgi:hypothetical protein